MTSKILILMSLLLSFTQAQAQLDSNLCVHCIPGQKVYYLDWVKDGLMMGTGLALYTTGFVLKDRADKATESDIFDLNRDDVRSFDRGATNNFSSSAQNISDAILYTSLAVPFITYITKEIQHEGLSIGIMAIETYLINDGITNILKGATKRYRPFTYNPELTTEDKLTANSRFSFISGHVSNVAAMSFFSAKVITDLHPELKNKGLIWGSAVTIPALVGYFRYKAGKHFPTDIIGGYLVGATVGYLVPKMHLSKNTSLGVGYNRSLSFRMEF